MTQFEKILSSPATWYLAGAFLLTVILRRFGILQTGSEQKAKAQLQKRVIEIEQSGDIWSTRFWQNYPAKQYSDQQAQNLAGHIKNSMTFLGDDEARIFGVFRQLNYQTNVSQISDAYTKLYGRDMHSDLRDALSSKEMNEVYDIISLKPL